jgi:hypothetical protein
VSLSGAGNVNVLSVVRSPVAFISEGAEFTRLTLQRYLIEYFAQPPSSMRDIGTVMAPLHVSH